LALGLDLGLLSLLCLRLLLRRLFALLLLGQVMADHASHRRARKGMVMGQVAPDGANGGALEAASLGKAGVRAECECQEQCNSFGFHISPRFQPAHPVGSLRLTHCGHSRDSFRAAVHTGHGRNGNLPFVSDRVHHHGKCPG
jgi:hypothetical protein